MAKAEVIIPKKDLYRLYHLENKSTLKIAKIYNCHHSTICNRLREFRIPIRFRYKIPKEDLIRLYRKENKSTIKIAKIYNCTSGAISYKLNKFGIPRKSKCQSRMRYPKHDFNGSPAKKAYLIGFGIGDLRVYKTKPDAETIVAHCHTTQNVQTKLMKDLFSKYGQVTIGKQKDGTFNVNCYLNKSFNFLLSKKDEIERWICLDKKSFCGFIAGYTDAEGNFILNQKRARFKIDSYDKGILYKMHSWLLQNNIKSKFRKIGTKGELRRGGYCFNEDLWRLNINEAYSLLRFITLVKPFIMHKKRLKDINLCLQNIIKRKELGTI